MKHQNRRHVWTPDENAILQRDYPDGDTAALAQRFGVNVNSIHRQVRKLGLKKRPGFMRDLGLKQAAPRRQRGVTAGQFPKGHAPWNKNLSYQPSGRCRETQFKKGHTNNRTVPIGHERVCSRDGYLLRKVTNDGPPYRHFRMVHVLVWEAAHGPVPKGHVVVFKDRGPRHLNITLDRLELITRVELMRRNSRHNLPEPIRNVLAWKARLTRVINEKTRQIEHS